MESGDVLWLPAGYHHQATSHGGEKFAVPRLSSADTPLTITP